MKPISVFQVILAQDLAGTNSHTEVYSGPGCVGKAQSELLNEQQWQYDTILVNGEGAHLALTPEHFLEMMKWGILTS